MVLSTKLRLSFLGYNIFALPKSEVLRLNTQKSKTLITTLNAYSYVQSQRNDSFKDALKKSDFLLPDGFPIVLAARLIRKKIIKKVAGADIHQFLLDYANIGNQKVFYLGSTNETLKKIEVRLKNELPFVRSASFSPPFKTDFSEKDNLEIINTINIFQPDILFIGMTAPKQEIWAFQNKEKIEAKIICCIGAVFDFYAETIKRAPNWMIKARMEWLYRLFLEPKRMWKRYLIHSPIFFWYLLLHLLKLRQD